MVVGLGFGTIVTIVALVIVMSFKVLREYQRAVVFMLVPVHLRAAHATDGFSAASENDQIECANCTQNVAFRY
jgi:hypothetical protein